MNKIEKEFRHAQRMARRRYAYHLRDSVVPPLAYNTSKYWPRIDTAKKDRSNAA